MAKGLLTEIAQIAYEFQGIGWDRLTEESKDIFRERTKRILAKIREVVEGAGLKNEGISVALNQANLTDEVYQEHEVVAQAQLQAILKAIDKEDTDGRTNKD